MSDTPDKPAEVPPPELQILLDMDDMLGKMLDDGRGDPLKVIAERRQILKQIAQLRRDLNAAAGGAHGKLKDLQQGNVPGDEDWDHDVT